MEHGCRAKLLRCKVDRTRSGNASHHVMELLQVFVGTKGSSSLLEINPAACFAKVSPLISTVDDEAACGISSSSGGHCQTVG